MQRTLRVVVVGAGVGGISIARALTNDGHDVVAEHRRGHQPAAIQLTRSGADKRPSARLRP